MRVRFPSLGRPLRIALPRCAVFAVLLLAACDGGALDAFETPVATPSPPPARAPLVRAISEGVEVYAEPVPGTTVLGLLPVGETFAVVGRFSRSSDWLAVEGAGWIPLDAAILETNFEVRDLLRITKPEFDLQLVGHPPETRTGVAVVDEVIDAVLARDAQRVIDRLNRRDIACQDPAAPREPLLFRVECRGDIPIGTKFTMTEGILTGCGGGYTPLGAVTPEWLGSWFGTAYEPLALYAVTANAESKTYSLAFTRGDSAGRFIRIAAGSGQVIAMGLGCGWTSAPAGIAHGSSFLLGPAEPDRLLPPPPPPLVPPLDAIIATVTTDDLNVRGRPELTHDVAFQVNTGDIVDVLGRSLDGDWLAVRGGWVFYDPDWLALSVGIETLEVVE